MFRILIVEDIIETLRQLKALLTESLCTTENELHQIETALTVEDAHKLIVQARADKRPYDAIILDLMLPKQLGDSTEVDESLCLMVQRFMPSTLIAHITAYTDDKTVREHLKNYHIEQIDRSFALSKTDIDYAQKLVIKLKVFLYSNQLERRLTQILGWPEASASIKPNQSKYIRMPGQESLTHEIAALTRDITRHWHDLDEKLKDQIRRIFYVDDASDIIRVSLLR